MDDVFSDTDECNENPGRHWPLVWYFTIEQRSKILWS